MSTYKELQNGSAYTFKNMSTGKMLNLYGGRTANGTNVCQYTADGSDDQKWTFFNDKLYAYGSSTKCLDKFTSSGSAKNNNADIWNNTDDVNQLLNFSSVQASDKFVSIQLKSNGYYLAAYDAVDYPGNRVMNSTANTDAGKTPTSAGNVYWSSTWLGSSCIWVVAAVDAGTSPDPEPEPGTYQGKMTLAELMAKFPNGKYWNHAGLSESNYQDGYTSTACDHSKSKEEGYIDTCNRFIVPGSASGSSSQCLGFAEKCGYDFSGSNPRDGAPWVKSEDVNMLDSIKAGDIIRYYSAKIGDAKNLHAIFVTGVNGENVVYGECNNSGNDCKIHWGGTKTKKTLRERFYFVRIAPFELQ